MNLQHKFVELIPENIEEGTLYITLEYCTAIHKCICGCGNEVVTPISPNDWQLYFNGKTISLKPSIGNWRFECRSHYWITNNEIILAPKWTEKNALDNLKKKEKKKRKRFLFLIKRKKA